MDTQPHERLVQMLSTILIQLSALQTLVDREPTEVVPDIPNVREGLTVLEQMTREVLFVVRSASDDLLPAELEGITLAEALSRMVEETAETLGLFSRVSFSGVDEQGRPKEHDLSNAARHVLYLIVREALYEVRQHMGARRLRLVLNYGPDDVQMSIEDDGMLLPTVEDVPVPAFATVGAQFIAPNSDASGTGVGRNELRPYIDLRYRIEHLGGSLEFGPQGEQGTRVSARVPYVQHVHDVLAIAPQPLPSQSEKQAAPAALERVRVLVVDGQAVTRAGLRRLLETYADLQVVGEAADGVQAVSETLELGPQVVLMDSQLPNGQSLEALRQIKQLNLDTKVLLLSAQDREEYLYETLRAGGDGYVLKAIAPDELAQAVRTVARGEMLVQPQLAGRLLSRFGRRGPYESLTVREREVLRLLARGLRNKEIAAQLYVSERTVNFHLANIYQKLNVSGRTEALSKALEQGLITP